MNKLEILIRQFADNNQDIDWAIIAAQMTFEERGYTQEKCEEMLALCDKYELEFPEMIAVSKSSNCYHYDIYYGYIKIIGHYYSNNDHNYIYCNNKGITMIIYNCIKLCEQYQKKIKMSREMIYMLMENSEKISFIEDVTATGDDNMHEVDDGENAESAADGEKPQETILDAAIEYANKNPESADMVIKTFKQSPNFEEFEKIILKSQSHELQIKIINLFVSPENFNDVFLYLVKIRRNELLPGLKHYIVALSEDELVQYLQHITCRKMAHALFGIYGIKKINYRIMSCILVNKKLGFPMMNELMRIIKHVEK